MASNDNFTVNKEFDLQTIFHAEENIKILNPKTMSRKHLYYILSGSKKLKERCSHLLSAASKYMESRMVPIKHRNLDFLELLVCDKGIRTELNQEEEALPEIRCLKNKMPLFPELRLSSVDRTKANREVLDGHKIGFQHVILSSLPGTLDASSAGSSGSDTSVQSDTSSDSGNILETESSLPKRGKFASKKQPVPKVCQEAKMVARTALIDHSDNFTENFAMYCEVDMLILVDVDMDDIGKDLARHMGLICLEDLSPQTDFIILLMDQDAKSYKRVQTYVASKLMKGYNNILITTNILAWNHIRANVKAIITSTAERHFTRISESDYVAVVSGEEKLLICIQAVSNVICQTLGFGLTLKIRYEISGNKLMTIDLPITSIIPLYIIRYFTQSHIRTVASKLFCDITTQKLFEHTKDSS